MRTVLLVFGLLLLVVFGVIAASQASNMKLAGSTERRLASMGRTARTMLGLGSPSMASVSGWEPVADIGSSPASKNASDVTTKSAPVVSSKREHQPPSTTTPPTATGHQPVIRVAPQHATATPPASTPAPAVPLPQPVQQIKLRTTANQLQRTAEQEVTTTNGLLHHTIK